MTTPIMDDLIYFTVTGNFKSLVADVESDPDYNPEVAEITATVTFTPLLNTGDMILATQASPPTAFVPVPIVGLIDTEGVLKLRSAPDPGGEGEYAPIRLLADQPKLQLKDPLFYRVDFTNVRFAGKPGAITGFTFQAPNADLVLDLVTVARQPGQTAAAITKIAPGAVRWDSSHRLQFSFGGEDIPDPLDVSHIKGDQGDRGLAATVRVGAVSSGATPKVTNVGTNTDAVFDFVLAKGDKGDQGVQGIPGATNTASDVTVAPDKVTPVDADLVPLVDSAGSWGLKKLSWANLKAAVKSYYDSVTATLTNKDLTSATNTFPSSLVTLTGVQSLSSKTLTSPTISSPTITDPKINTIKDANGNTSLNIAATANAINYFSINNTAGTDAPSISAKGPDATVALWVVSKGTGGITLTSDSNGRVFVATPVASGVNFIRVRAGATGVSPAVVADSVTDTNADLLLESKGTGTVKANGVDVVTTTGSQALSNKTISGTNNTLTAIPVTAISATGTPSASTYLRGDGTWAAASGGGYTLPVATTTVLGGVKQGNNVTIAADGTISAAVASVAGRTGAVTLTAADLTDSSTVGRSVVTAASAAAARTAIGATDLTIGTTASTACAGNDPRLSDARTPTAAGQVADMSIVTFGAQTVRATGTGDNPFGIKLQRAITVQAVTFRVATADASGNLVVELRKNGVAVAGTSTTVAAASQVAGGTTTGTWSFTAGDILTVHVTGVGATPGKGLVADIKGLTA